jgi:uncharacterized membrane protein YhaH (DUF805 family)
MFKSPFSFQGRIRRKEYLITVFLFFIVTITKNLIYELVEGGTLSLGAKNVAMIMHIVFFFVFLAAGIKRCHDTNRTGLYIIIPFYFIYLMFAAPYNGISKYGGNPRAFS